MVGSLPTKTIVQLASGLVTGYVRLGAADGAPVSVRRQVHDGDTVNVRAVGAFGVRFLGVDAPEISFTLPGDKAFRSLGGEAWDAFLRDPFAAAWPPFDPPLPAGLRDRLAGLAGEGCAANHHAHAEAAEDALEALVAGDIAALGTTPADIVLFLAFAHEVMDRYGRFLCYVNRYQPNAQEPAPRPRPYNERLLALGMTCPYFIWPNLDPFLGKLPSVVAAVVAPGGAREVARRGRSGPRAAPCGRHGRQSWASSANRTPCGCTPSRCASSRAGSRPTAG
jgi:hypothetical protein